MIGCIQNNNMSRWDKLDSSSNKQHLVVKYNHKMKNVKCGCVVLDETLTYIVLVQNNYAYLSGKEQWGLPKGQRECGETFANCASRELLEETGLNIPIRNNMLKIKIINTYYFPIIVKHTPDLYPNDKDEIRSAKWFPIADMDKVPINKETKLFIKLKLDKITKP